MATCDSNKVRVYTVNNAGASANTKLFAHTWAMLWGRMRVQALLGSLKYLEEGSVVSNGNAPVSSVYPDPLGLTGMVMKVDTDEGKVEHSGVNTHG